MAYFNGAVSRYKLFNPYGYNIPKQKFMYYVNFVPSNSELIDIRENQRLNFSVKRIDRLQMQYDVQELNQYNKHRLIQTRIQYQPLSFTLHDLVDETALRMIECYNRFYYGDFLNKNNNSWNYDITGGAFESTPNWGLNTNFTGNNGYFFSRIEIYEIYNQSYTQVNFINPKFTNIDFQNLDQEVSQGNEVNVTFKYEGVVIEKINEFVTPEISEKFGIPFVANNGNNITPFFNSGPINTGSFLSTLGQLGANAFGNYILSGSDAFNAQNLFNTIVTPQNLPGVGGLIGELSSEVNTLIFGAQPNSLYGGRINFDDLGNTGRLIPLVGDRLSDGDVVRDVSTAVVNTFSKILKF